MNGILAAILNGAILSVPVAVAVWVGLRLAPRRMLSAATRYVVWWAALVAVVMLPLGYLRISPPSRVAFTADPSWEPARSGDAGRMATPLVPVRSLSRDAALAPRLTPHPAGVRFPLVVKAGAWTRWILAVWASVSALLLARLSLSCILLERRKRGVTAAATEIAARVEEWLARSGYTRRGVRLVCSAHVGTPMVAGLRRPAILIPARLAAELGAADLEQIGLHEAAHLARRDDYALLVQRAVEALCVFHPVVRWITRQIDLEREIACDDAVVETLGQPREYAACLTRMVEICGGVRASWAGTAATGNRSHLAQRVDRLLDRNRQARVRTGRVRLAMAVGLVAALAAVAAKVPSVIALAMPVVEAAPPVAIAPAIAPADEPPPAVTVAEPVTTEPAETAVPVPQQAAASGGPSPVTVNVSVQDQANRYIGDLSQFDFQVLEDGVEQQIAEFAAKSPALSVGVVLDASGSMGARRDLIDMAVMQLVKAPNPVDEFFPVTFNTEVQVGAMVSRDGMQIANLWYPAQPRGGTALRDAIYAASQRMTDAHNPKKIVLVLSDGVDNASRIGTSELVEALLAAKVEIDAITFAPPATYPGGSLLWLRDLAQQTGGREFVADDPSTVQDAAASIVGQTYYQIQYQSTNPVLDGKYRRLLVKLVTPQPMPVKLSFRQGYYADKQW